VRDARGGRDSGVQGLRRGGEVYEKVGGGDEEDLDDSLSFYDFPDIDKKRIASTNGQERLNREIRRRSRVVGVFPSVESYIRLTICYQVEYTEDWSGERSYIREDKIIKSLEKLHELTSQIGC